MSSFNELLSRQRPGPWQKFLANHASSLRGSSTVGMHLFQLRHSQALLLSSASPILIHSNQRFRWRHPGSILVISRNRNLLGNFRQHPPGYAPCLIPPKFSLLVIMSYYSIQDRMSGWAASERAQLDRGDIIYLGNEKATICRMVVSSRSTETLILRAMVTRHFNIPEARTYGLAQCQTGSIYSSLMVHHLLISTY